MRTYLNQSQAFQQSIAGIASQAFLTQSSHGYWQSPQMEYSGVPVSADVYRGNSCTWSNPESSGNPSLTGRMQPPQHQLQLSQTYIAHEPLPDLTKPPPPLPTHVTYSSPPHMVSNRINQLQYPAQQSMPAQSQLSNGLLPQIMIPERMRKDVPQSISVKYMNYSSPPSLAQGIVPNMMYQKAPVTNCAQSSFTGETTVDEYAQQPLNWNFGTTDEFGRQPHCAMSTAPLSSQRYQPQAKNTQPAQTAPLLSQYDIPRVENQHPVQTMLQPSCPLPTPNDTEISSKSETLSIPVIPKSGQITPPTLVNGMRTGTQQCSSMISDTTENITHRDRRPQRRHSGSSGDSCHRKGSVSHSIKRPSYSLKEEQQLSADIENSYGYRLNELMERCFSKRERFSSQHSLDSSKIPNMVDELFASPRWSDANCAELALLKERLNAVKDNLGSYDLNKWHTHTRTTNPADMVMRRLRSDIKVEFLTQAWCKFYELVNKFKLVPHEAVQCGKLRSVHLCEAPGAFVASLNHYLRLNHPTLRWEWKANSLNPYYEGNHLSSMINDDRFILQTIDNWDFGPDLTGDIMHPDYPDYLRNLYAGDLPHLVTADGSFDCQDKPDEQESLVSWLHLKEALTAIRILRKGGHFVIKMFTFFECESVCLLFLLRCLFESIDVMKPATSKEGNSEVYVVCRKFKDDPAFEPFIRRLLSIDEETYKRCAMFPIEHIPRPFLNSVVNCATKFATFQMEVIERNIRLFHDERYNEYRRHFRFVQEKVFERYIRDYQVETIPLSETVVRMPYRKYENRTFTSSKVVEQRDRKQGSHEDQLKRSGLGKADTVKVVVAEVANFPDHELRNRVSTVPKVDIQPQDCEIRFGNPIHSIFSSQFCHGMLMRLRNELRNVIDSKQYYIAASEMEKSANLEDCPDQFPNLCDFARLLMRTQNYNDTQRLIFKVLYDRLAMLQPHEDLTLFCFPLLTQFNISILCILNQIFKEIRFEPPNIMYLSDRSTNNYELWMPKLAEVCQAYVEGKAIISLLPVHKITETKNKFYTFIIEANNTQLLREIQLISLYHSS